MLAAFALFAWSFSLLCDVGMWFVIDDYDPLAQTISELGAGAHHWIQDLGLVVFALGILAVARSLHLRRSSGAIARLLQGALVLLALDVSLIGLWNEYGDGQPGGVVIHRYLVWALYALVPSILWLESRVAPIRGRRSATICKASAIGWLIAAPIYKLVPPGFDGGYERLLALVLGSSVSIVAWRLYRTTDDGDG